MFQVKRRLALLAIPGAALAMIGGGVVAQAYTGGTGGPAVTTNETSGAETPEAAGAPEVAGAADTGPNVDQQVGQQVDQQGDFNN